VFCREQVSDLRAAVAADPSFPAVLLFALQAPEHARTFFDERWPEVPVVCDASGSFHRDLLGAQRMHVWDLLRPTLWRRVWAARRKGHVQGKPQGDVWRLGGALLVQGGAVVWRFVAKDASAHPDLSAVPRIAAASRGPAAPAR
jgi:hypothetical protein